jgi:hypothetical protein
MELNDQHSTLLKQEKDIEGLEESEEEPVIPSGDETDSYSEGEWDRVLTAVSQPQSSQSSIMYVPDPDNPFTPERIYALIDKFMGQ